MFRRLVELIRMYTKSPEAYARSKGVKIGKGCWIQTRKFPSEGYLIEIGNHVRIAPETALFTHGGLWTIRRIYNDKELEIFGKIKIGNYSYIGQWCMILPGVTIGERCIVAAGTVLTKSVPDGCMVAGNPARFIGYTEDLYKRTKNNYNFHCKKMSRSEKRNLLLSMPDSSFKSAPEMKQK